MTTSKLRQEISRAIHELQVAEPARGRLIDLRDRLDAEGVQPETAT